MANPKFRDLNDASVEYIWADLPYDGVPPVTEDRDYIHFTDVQRSPTGEIVGIHDRGRLRPKTLTIDVLDDDMVEFQKFFEKGAAWFYPDSALGTRFQVTWDPELLAPDRIHGGRYQFQFALIETPHTT